MLVCWSRFRFISRLSTPIFKDRLKRAEFFIFCLRLLHLFTSEAQSSHVLSNCSVLHSINSCLWVWKSGVVLEYRTSSIPFSVIVFLLLKVEINSFVSTSSPIISTSGEPEAEKSRISSRQISSLELEVLELLEFWFLSRGKGVIILFPFGDSDFFIFLIFGISRIHLSIYNTLWVVLSPLSRELKVTLFSLFSWVNINRQTKRYWEFEITVRKDLYRVMAGVFTSLDQFTSLIGSPYVWDPRLWVSLVAQYWSEAVVRVWTSD